MNPLGAILVFIGVCCCLGGIVMLAGPAWALLAGGAFLVTAGALGSDE